MKCYLSKNNPVQGIPVRFDTFVLFHDNGKLAACRLDEDYFSGNVRCKAGGWIGFHENGSLKRCVIAEDIFKNGLLLRLGAWAAFHRNGVIENYKLTEDARIQGIDCCTGDILLFDEEGRVIETIRTLTKRD
jgi:hypothetical protein